MSHDNQAAAAAPTLRGATASIFLAMILHPVPQTAKSLQLATGYSFKPVRAALRLLEKEGLIRYDGRIYAWMLESGTPLLNRLQQAMSMQDDPPPASQGVSNRGYRGQDEAGQRSSDSAAVDDTAVDDLSTELSTDRPQGIGESPIRVGESSTEIGESPIGAGKKRSPDAAGYPETIGESPTRSDKSPTKIGESPTEIGESPPSRGPGAATTAVSKTSKKYDQEKASKHADHKRPKSAVSMPDDRERVLSAWLIRGGIGGKSAKMRELLARDLELETVKAHVLERQAREAGLVKEKGGYSAGLLIHKLLEGDPAPPLRCEHCLRLPDRLGWCRCDYEAVIKR